MDFQEIHYFGIIKGEKAKEFLSLEKAFESKSRFILVEQIGHLKNGSYVNKVVKYLFFDGIKCTSEIEFSNWKIISFDSEEDEYHQKIVLVLKIAAPNGEIKTKRYRRFIYEKEEMFEFLFTIEKLQNWEQVELFEENQKLRNEIEYLKDSLISNNINF
jgi:hypothetical protein